ncbi:hypothetical protein [Salisediminibacterium halotolerans]|uniref:hypothetical protein n=1 Tax=Salisediminibacterium halotolerans TaxID=517425 RepID=UPI001315664A|nr:hypothetical protein [Salisediminibacterium halotolerans]
MLSSYVILIKDRMTTHRPAYFLRASAGGFGLMPCRVSSVSLSRGKKPGCWVILFFEASLFIKKRSHASTPPTPPGKQETKIRIRRSQASEY